MKYLIISDRKIKISLQKEDMEKYGLLPSETDYDNEKCRKIFWQILDEAKRKIHFDLGEERALLQMYPKADGGGELFVMKLGTMTPSGIKKAEESDRVTTLKNERVTYRFPDVETLSSAAKIVLHFDGREESDVYLDEDGNYFLTVLQRPDGKAKYLCLCEYGDVVPKSMECYWKEHGKRLSEGDGIERFSTL